MSAHVNSIYTCENEVKWPLLDEWFEARAMSLAVISILWMVLTLTSYDGLFISFDFSKNENFSK